MTQPLLLLELNEVNFEGLEHYFRLGRLPTFRRLFERHGFARTVSETQYEHLEPWIQWVTAHTGLRFADHKVFRLGDIVNTQHPQIWEVLEAQGLNVGAISPMNATNRTRDAAFFVPDPWTTTRISGPKTLNSLYFAIAQAVNDNAEARISTRSAAALASGMLRHTRIANWPTYARLISTSVSRPWRRAMVLDLLLADIFVGQLKQRRPDFASLFVNAAAHIQHHYMFNSSAYASAGRNPAWYVKAGADPVGEIYDLYDRIVSDVIRANPSARIMLATAIHQEPHPEVTFYWRLKKHSEFLKRLQIAHERVQPRMSRDFLVNFADSKQALLAQAALEECSDGEGARIFEVDNRGPELFVTLVYASDIPASFELRCGGRALSGFRNEVSFVAIKNGRHSGIGYFLDTGLAAPDVQPEFELASLPARISAALGATWPAHR